MSKVVLGLIVTVTLAGVGWYLRNITESNTVLQATEEVENNGAHPTSTPRQATTNQSNVQSVGEAQPGLKLYRNDEFGFEFQHPADWEIRVPAFKSAVSLFNMAFDPSDKHNAEVVSVNITPKEWVENALVKMRARGVVTKDVTLDGRPAIEFKDKGSFSRPATITLVLVDDTFWIDITGVLGYEEGYEQVLDSFRFIR